MSLSLDQANAVISAALAEASRRALKPVAVVVLDAGGHLVACQRQDGASTGRIQVALGKAGGALFLGVPSRKVAEMAGERPTFIASLGPLAPVGIVPAAGGVLAVDAEGAVLGAVGISGDTSDNDEACVLAGLVAAGVAAQS